VSDTVAAVSAVAHAIRALTSPYDHSPEISKYTLTVWFTPSVLSALAAI